MKKNPYSSNALIMLLFTAFFAFIPLSMDGGYVLTILILIIMVPIIISYFKFSNEWEKFEKEKIIDYDEYKKALKNMKNGNLEARFIICEYHYKRFLTFRDKEDASQFKEHAKILLSNKHEEINYVLGHAYFFGEAFEPDASKAIYHLEKARSFGDDEATYLLSCIYLDKEHDSFYDYEKGVACLLEASNKNHPYAQHKLALLLEEEEMYEEAKKWYMEAYKNGISEAKEGIDRLSSNNQSRKDLFMNELFK